MTALRKIAACHKSAVAEIHARELGASLADLHYRLGKKIEDRPGVINRPEPEAKPWDSDVRCFEGLRLDTPIASTAGLDAFAADARARMGEARWAELNAEWNEGTARD